MLQETLTTVTWSDAKPAGRRRLEINTVRATSGFLLQMLTLQHVSFIAVILVSYIHNVSLQTPGNKLTLTQFCLTVCYSQQFTRSLTRAGD
jgi:hypothetical protein